MNRAQLIKAAKLKVVARRRKQKAINFDGIVGAFVREGLMHTNYPLELALRKVTVSQVLAAGAHEPRLLEILPAILLKKLGFVEPDVLPEDLKATMRSLKHQETPEPFRGVPGEKMKQWLSRVGHQGVAPSVTKTFRFPADEAALLRQLSKRTSESESALVRRALRQLAETLNGD